MKVLYGKESIDTIYGLQNELEFKPKSFNQQGFKILNKKYSEVCPNV